ncbi:MAG: LysM peptidoglycan-binding domain-containing protein [Bacteroidota bacterium]
MHLNDVFHMRGISSVLFAGLIAAFAVACSSQGELTKEERSDSGSATAALLDTLAPDPNAPLLPRPELVIDGVPPTLDVTILEKEPLLDRARMHIVLAAKALENGDTLVTVNQCTLATEKLDRASYLPDIDDDDNYVELSARLRTLYRACASTIEQSDLELPMSALATLADESTDADTIDLSVISFKEPPPTVIPLPLNPEVEKNIIYFTTKMRKHFVKWIERSGRYFPLMRPILKEEGMPDEIIFLTMIESGVNPIARSWAACVGLWQFLKSTGEMYGLKGDWHTDDRCDPEKATRAAARHLRDLYNRFDDWHLALAAYNAGAGRISRAIKKSGKAHPTYWEVREYLPKETQNYVPRFIAASIVALDPQEYDMAELVPLRPLEYDVVATEKPYHLKDLALVVGSSMEDLQELNPTLLQSITPARKFDLRIPKGRSETFASNIRNVEVRSTTETVIVDHKVRRGETIYKLAKKYHVTVGQIIKTNELSSARRLRVGEVLRIPRQETVATTAYKVAMDNVANPDSEVDPTVHTNGRQKLTVKVESGMTLGGMARNFGVTVTDLMTWNSLSSDDRLLAGSTMDVWVKGDQKFNGDTSTIAELRSTEGVSSGGSSSAATKQPSPSIAKNPDSGIEASASASKFEYTVQRGETLASIAETFNVTIQNLIEWNELKSTKIRSGSKLKLETELLPGSAEQSLQQEKPDAKKSAVHGKILVQEKASAKKEPTSQKSTREIMPDAPKTAPEKAVPTKDQKTSTAAAVSPNTASTVQQNDSLYTVTKGETLYRISVMHGVTVAQIMEWNSLPEPSIQVGQQLIVGHSKAEPMKTVTVAASKPEAAEKADKTVKPEAAEKADKTKTSATPFKIENAVKSDQAAAAAAVTDDGSEAPLVTEAGVYTVQPGDNLYRIARAAGMSVEELKKLNGLKSSAIVNGQKLTVASPGAAGTLRSDAAPKVQQKAPVQAKAAGQDKAADQAKAGKLENTAPLENAETQNGSAVSAANGIRHEHVVERGETLNSISRKYDIPVSKLKEWNDLGRFLNIGQKIVYYTTQ